VQGSPLIPDDLRVVSASEAAAICILSDTSRCAVAVLQASVLSASTTPASPVLSAPSCLGPACCLSGFIAAAHVGPLHVPALCERRYPEESDAQSLRTAVLLDELDYPGAGLPDPRTAHVVVELKTANAIPLLRYCCGPRIMALPTAQLNARRCAGPVQLSRMLASGNRYVIQRTLGKLLGRQFRPDTQA